MSTHDPARTPSPEPSEGAPDDRSAGLLAWQWAHYREGHVDRTNLVLHGVSVPMFLLGTLSCVASPLVGWPLAAGGATAMVAAVVAQGRGHAREARAPIPFRGAGDAIARLFVEQWVTFPRFVLGGAFAEAWRAAGRGPRSNRES